MKILNIYSPNAITEATELLGSGHVIIYPTDTLYGLGADALNSDAVEKISKIKGRLGPWSIAVSDFKMLKSSVPYQNSIQNLLEKDCQDLLQ